MKEDIELRTKAVLADLHSFGYDASAYDLADGESNAAILAQKGTLHERSLPHVVRFPLRGQVVSRQKLLAETLVLAMLADARAEAPVEIPEVYEWEEEPLYVVTSLVPGQTLEWQDVRQFSPAEKQAAGRIIGETIAWIAGNLSPDTYQREIDYYPQRQNLSPIGGLSRRERMLQQQWERQDEIRGQGFGAAAEVLTDLFEEYAGYWSDRKYRPNIIGHDDLHVHNLRFTGLPGQRKLHGVIDFEATKPSTVERELRHIYPLGDLALQAAIDGYEGLSGERVDEALVHFWTEVQAITIYNWAVLKGRRTSGSSDDAILILRDCYPDKDWPPPAMKPSEGLSRRHATISS